MSGILHKRSLPTSNAAACAKTQFGCNGFYAALPYARSSIAVYSLYDQSRLLLDGHHRPITALRFCHSLETTLLCSASDDYVISWDIDQAILDETSGKRCRGRIVCESTGSVSYLSVSEDDRMIALCIDCNIHIHNIQGQGPHIVLDGHAGQVNCAEFCVHFSATLVSVSDDRTFKVWGLETSTILYQSPIISSSPFISLAMNPNQPGFSIGSADGKVRIYEIVDGSDCRCLHQLDVAKQVSKIQTLKASEEAALKQTSNSRVTISSRPSWQKTASSTSTTAAVESESMIQSSVIGLYYTSKSVNSTSESNSRTTLDNVTSLARRQNSIMGELLGVPPLLMIGTTNAILSVNAATFETLTVSSLQDPVMSSDEAILSRASKKKVIGLASNIMMNQSSDTEDNEDVELVMLRNLAPNVANLSVMSLDNKYEEDGAWWREGEEVCEANSAPSLSVLSSAPLLPHSILRSELVPKTAASATTATRVNKSSKLAAVTGKPGSVGKKGQIVDDLPVTFHTKIKSSGYTSEPRRMMFQPKTSINKKTTIGRFGSCGKICLSASSDSLSSGASKNIDRVLSVYPMVGEPPVYVGDTWSVSDRPVAITSLKLTGHSQSLTSVSWTNDGASLLTSSDDKTATLWSMGKSEPLMTFTNINTNLAPTADKLGGPGVTKPTKDNPAFSKSIISGRFYYMDRFILLASGTSFYLYKYHVDKAKSDLKRFISNTKYKLVKSFQMKNAPQIKVLSTINSFYSYVVLCAGSDRSLELFDMNVGACVQTLSETHTKAVHCITQNAPRKLAKCVQGSAYVSHPNSAYELFLTSAVTDGIKLWDIRSNRCVRRYDGHVNRVHHCEASFSPCGRFVATGSEDRALYIYDIRQTSYLHKLPSHSEAVLCVGFHPRYPQLISGSSDGEISEFNIK